MVKMLSDVLDGGVLQQWGGAGIVVLSFPLLAAAGIITKAEKTSVLMFRIDILSERQIYTQFDF